MERDYAYALERIQMIRGVDYAFIRNYDTDGTVLFEGYFNKFLPDGLYEFVHVLITHNTPNGQIKEERDSLIINPKDFESI